MDRRFSEFRNQGRGASASGSTAKNDSAPWRLFERQQIPPASNAGRFAADWLPEFAGYSWIAYGAESQLVIRIISSPESDEPGVNRLFQQVLETRLSVEISSPVSAVSWGPPSHGNLAAASGEFLHVFAPIPLTSSKTTALPLEWNHRSLLGHTSPVAHFSWTSSGDGILAAAGSKVLMWKLNDSGEFSLAWQAQVSSPQAQCAATRFHRGLAATSRCEDPSSKGNATIWWWEDEDPEPQAVELGHPKHVVDLQWRPELPSEQHRPILLTSCSDGAVRLWLEIDSGKARLEKKAKKDRCLKPAFFVSAVIEVNSSLQASLGVDCFVTWTTESFQDPPGEEVAACEWIVGVGPGQSIALWCLHCLDDVSPPRCPRVLLWQQGKLPVVESETPEGSPVCLKGVAHRLQRSVPPTSVDLVEFYPGGLIRSSRVWPPVSSVSSTKSSLDSDSVSKAGTWGRSSRDFFTYGHRGGKVKVALHPESFRGVAASVDESGVLLLWRTSCPLEPHVESPGVHTSAWRLSARVPGRENALPSVCWSPVSVPGEKLVLLTGCARGVLCYLIAKENYRLRQDLIIELKHDESKPFEELHAFEKLEGAQPVAVVVASRSDGVLLGWRLVARVCEKNSSEQECGSFHYKGPLVEDKESLCISSSSIKELRLTAGERVLTFTTGRNSPYDLISSSEDGTVKLWRLSSASWSWEVVGQFTGNLGRFTLAASGRHGTQLATSAQGSAVDVWEIVCSSSGFLLCHSARIALPQAPGAMSWFEGVDGVSLLGIAAGEDVCVYAEGRRQASDHSEWISLASMRASSCVSSLSWGVQGSLVLSSGNRITILSHWVESSSSSREQETGAVMLLRAALSATSTRSNCHPMFIFQELLMNGEQQLAHLCLRRFLSPANAQAGELILELPNVQYRDLQKPSSLKDVSNHRTWTFGKPVDDPEEAQDSGAPLSSSELGDLAEAVNRFKDGAQLLTIVELLRSLERVPQFQFLDQPGQRFALLILFNRVQKLESIESKPIAWALQSECKSELIDMLVPPDDLSWSALRAIGAGYWFTDVEQLRLRIEKMARAQFLRSRDPKDCALFYIVLDRKSVLSGLCKMSRDERDKPLVEFFARNFKDEKNRTAALKNAYVLLGKHRHELAAAFFLLGGELESAVSVCARNLGDPQLALVLSRLVEGISGQTASLLISQELLPNAQADDRWLAAVFQILLGERLAALHELVGGDDRCLASSFNDSHVGEFCRVLLSKPGMEANPSVLSRGFRSSARSLEKHGYPLQALKLLQKCVPGDETRGGDWLSPEVAKQLSKLAVEHLVSKYLLQFVEQHPAWENLNPKASSNEDTILQDITILETELFLDRTAIIHSLASISWHYGRPSFGAWLLESQNQLASSWLRDVQSSLSTAGPEVLCSTILASGDTTHTKVSRSRPAMSQELIDRTDEASLQLERTSADASCSTLSQVEELRVCASQINQLRFGSHPRVKGSEVSMLAFVVCVGAAWLRKQTQLLTSMLRMMLESERVDSGIFQRVHSELPPEADELSWLLLSVSLWKHVAVFVKRQLTGGEGVATSEAGQALLSAVSCIYGRLRKQMMQRLLETGKDQAILSLMTNESSEGFSELWKLLAVNDEVRSAGLDRGASKTKWIAKNAPADLKPSSSPGESSRQSRSFTVKGLLRSHFNTRFGKGDTPLRLPGDTLEAMAVNNCSPEQVVIASANKGLVYVDLDTYTSFTDAKESLWAEADWPQNGWAGSISTPIPTFVSPGVGLGSKGGSGIGLGGATVGLGTISKEYRKGAVGFGVPGYAGMAAWSLGWEEMTDFDSLDTPATAKNMNTSATASHPLRPYFLVGARNTHVYLWKFGEASPTATYGVLPAANVPPPYALASVSCVEFDRSGHRFVSSAVDGTVCAWQLEVGGRSNVCPTESQLCFDPHAWDVAFIGESGAIVAATGSSRSGENLVIWNTLAPPSSARLAVACHEGGARCLAVAHENIGGSPLIITGGKSGDLSVHDFRYISSGKSKRQTSNKNSGTDVVWHLSNAHSGSISKIRSIPGTSLFLTASRDGDVKLWDLTRNQMIKHWRRLHEKRVFLQLVPAPVTDLRVLPDGFISCGTDGVVKHFRLESESESP